jgi:hypothetical protein
VIAALVGWVSLRQPNLFFANTKQRDDSTKSDTLGKQRSIALWTKISAKV